jgi:hypothetical protein
MSEPDLDPDLELCSGSAKAKMFWFLQLLFWFRNNEINTGILIILKNVRI